MDERNIEHSLNQSWFLKSRSESTLRFQARTTWTVLEIVSEPYLVVTFRGYTPAVQVRESATGACYDLLIGGIKSLAEGLEALRPSNGGKFKGLRFTIKKESSDRFSRYQIGPAHSGPVALDSKIPSDDIHKRVPVEDRLWHSIIRKYRS